MELTISLWTYINGVLVAAGSLLLGTIIKPMIMVWRDRWLWQYIEKKHLTKEIRRDISTAGSIRRIKAAEYPWHAMIVGGKSGCAYQIGDKEVSKTEYDHYRESKINKNNRLRELEYRITSHAVQVDRLLKHFAQDISNPIREWCDDELPTAEEIELATRQAKENGYGRTKA